MHTISWKWFVMAMVCGDVGSVMMCVFNELYL